MTDESHRSSAVLVRAESVSKTYRDGSTEIHALRDVDLEVRRGELVSLVGASGSGKSTLLSLLAGLRRPDSGTIWFDGTDVTALGDTERATLRGRRIGVVLQRGNLIPFLTARENIELTMELAPGDRPWDRAMYLLDSLGVAHCAHRQSRQLSGGEAQRVAVAMALANEPDVVLADEATGELDGPNAEQVMAALFGPARERERAVLYVTHDRRLAGRAERQLLMVHGRVVT